MFALLIKPGVHKRSKYATTINNLVAQGAVVLMSTEVTGLKSELIALKAANAEITLIACGGDGTVHLAINACFELEMDLAVIPMGTGNDFARYIGVKNKELGLATIQTGAPKPMDVGVIKLHNGEQHYFAGIASCGFDAEVNGRANRYRGPAGTAKYLVAVFQQLSTLKAQRLNLKIDAVTQAGEYTLVAIANTNSYGGGMKVCPTADAYDGEFEITMVDRVSRSLLVRVLPRVFWGGHVKHPKVSQSVGQFVSITDASPLIYADGERIGRGPASFDILPNAIRVWQAIPSQHP